MAGAALCAIRRYRHDGGGRDALLRAGEPGGGRGRERGVFPLCRGGPEVGDPGERAEGLPYRRVKAEIVPGKADPAYDSAVVHGRALVVRDAEEKWQALQLLVQTLDPVSVEKAHMCSQQSMERTMIVKLVPEEITGKQGKGDD